MPVIHSKKPHLRTIDKINMLVRLEIANPMLSSTEIAALCGLNIQRFSVLKRHPYYVKIHNQYMTGVIADLELAVKSNLNMTQETLNFAVPLAMQNLLKQAIQEKDLRVQNKACNDLLDRHGKFAKVTRVGLPSVEQGGVADNKDNEAVLEMLQAMKQLGNNKTNTNQTPANISDPPSTDSIQ